MLEHVDLCERCARRLFPLLEAPHVQRVEMGYVANIVSQCSRCRRHAPAILAAQRRFDRERARDAEWHVFDPSPSSTGLVIQNGNAAAAYCETPVGPDWVWIEAL
jgi:hypothetical protein